MNVKKLKKLLTELNVKFSDELKKKDLEKLLSEREFVITEEYLQENPDEDYKVGDVVYVQLEEDEVVDEVVDEKFIGYFNLSHNKSLKVLNVTNIKDKNNNDIVIIECINATYKVSKEVANKQLKLK